MRSLIALVLLGQILGCTGHPLIPDLHLPRFPPCDDPEIEHAAKIAVNHINAHTLDGYKYVLNIIKKAKVLPRRPTGELLLLELDLLETTCHVLSKTPAANCTVRGRTEHAVEGDCNVKILKHEGDYRVINVHCHSSPDSAEDVVKFCPECPILLPLTDAHVINAVNTAINQFNAQNLSTYYQILEISRGQISHLPPAYRVEFAIVITNCSGQDAHDHPQNCHPVSGQNSQSGFCKATIFKHTEAPAPASPLKDKVHCTVFNYQPGFLHPRLTEQHLGRKILFPRHGYTVLDLIHSHNDSHASHESLSVEVPIVPPVVKRAVENPLPLGPAPVGPTPFRPATIPPLCPGKIRFFSID